MREDSTFTVQIGDRGRLVLPAAIRDRLGLKAGDTLLASIDEDGGVHLASLRENARSLRGVVKHGVRKRSLAGELIEERRRESEDA